MKVPNTQGEFISGLELLKILISYFCEKKKIGRIDLFFLCNKHTKDGEL